MNSNSRQKLRPEITRKCMLDVAEYIGANERFYYEKYKAELDPFCKQWSKLYRVWPQLGNKSLAKLESEVTSKSYFSATQSMDAIHEIIDRIGYTPVGHANDKFSTHMVVTFSGWGFDPFEYLLVGLDVVDLSEKDEIYIRDVMIDNEYQQEIIVLRILSPMTRVTK